MPCSHPLFSRCLSSFVCILTVSCEVTPPQAPQSAPVPTQTPAVQVYTLDTPEIRTVEALGSEAAGRVVLGRNRLDNPVYLSDYSDKVVLVNYWTSQCATCWQHITDLYWTYKEYKKLGLVVINVNYGETVQTIGEYLSTRDPDRVTIQLSDRSGQASAAQGVLSVPAAVVYGPDRSVLARYGNDLEVELIRRDLREYLR